MYYEKYIKYKNKYLKLKNKVNMSGGGDKFYYSYDPEILMPTKSDIDNYIKKDKTCYVIFKKIAPFLEEKINLNIIFILEYVTFYEEKNDDFDWNLDDYVYDQYLERYYPNSNKLSKYLLIGLEGITGKNIKPKINRPEKGLFNDNYYRCYKSKIDLNDKITVFEAFNKYLPGQLSWSGGENDEIRIFTTKQKDLPKKLDKIKKGLEKKKELNKITKKNKKKRPSPSESATKFKVGTKKKGNDGNMWIIIENKNGVKRWNKIK